MVGTPAVRTTVSVSWKHLLLDSVSCQWARTVEV